VDRIGDQAGAGRTEWAERNRPHRSGGDVVRPAFSHLQYAASDDLVYVLRLDAAALDQRLERRD
jgi:broad-specificity NMP kinase